ncbi:MAG: glycoside hydrolase, partial [Tenericutes bacterium HGW-Tenericutes-6]
WPLCGEIDLVEFAGNRPGIISSAIHTKAYNHKINTQIGKRFTLPSSSTEFHDYELLWTSKKLQFSVDGNIYLTVEKKENDTEEQWPFDQPYYLLINLAVGGWYGGQIDDESFPYEFEVDSIKYYQEK